MSRQLPIDNAYFAANDALSVRCPTCAAARGTYCHRDDGRLRRIPCLRRAIASGAQNYAPEPSRGRDFSEPLVAREIS